MGKIIRFEAEPADGLMPSGDVPAETFTTEDKTERDYSYFANRDESVTTGVWECAPATMTFDSYYAHELMTVLSGSVTVTNHETDSADTFMAGDTFFVEKGSNFTFEITETLRKYYFIVTGP